MAKLIRLTTVPVSLHTLLRGQLRFMNQYFDVIGISSPGEKLQKVEDDEGVRTYAVPMTRTISPFKDLRALFHLIKIFRIEKPHIVHTHTPKAGTLGMIAAWLCKVPIRLHTVAGLPLLEVKGKTRKLLDLVEKITYKCATKIFPNSFGLRDIIIENNYTNREKVKVIGNGSSNGIDTDYFSTGNINNMDIRRLKEQYSISSGDFVFIFIGRIVREKGITELVSAFTNLNTKYPDTKLLLVGTFEDDLDPLGEETLDTIKKHADIKCTGYQQDIRPFLGASDVLVFPSYREGLPNVPLQACAMELPCIVTNINGCNEIIDHEFNGLIVPPKKFSELLDAMENIMVNEKLYRKLSSNARKSIEDRYEQKLLQKEIKDEYEKLLRLAGYL